MVGLGHMRRNLLIAQTIAASSAGRSSPPAILMVAEARQASSFTAAMPPGMDCLTLPALVKGAADCGPRYLNLAAADLVRLRAKTVRAALGAFRPDVMIVDHLSRGAANELAPALELLHARGGTRFVLGLRDVLEDPATVEHEWRHARHFEAIRRYYDAIWVYGDPAVFDLVREYRLPDDIAAKVRYTGYLDQRRRRAFVGAATTEHTEGAPAAPLGLRGDPAAALGMPPGRLVLCLLGGGQDGGDLAQAFVAAFTGATPPAGVNGLLVTGPFMPAPLQQRLRRLASDQPRLRVLAFHPEPTLLLRHADRVVAMGGYNTTLEVLSFRKRALLVPRDGRRREQVIRAERLRDLGLLDVLPAHDVSADAIAHWLATDARRQGRPRRGRPIDLAGLERIPRLFEEVLGASSAERDAELHDTGQTSAHPAHPGPSWGGYRASA